MTLFLLFNTLHQSQMLFYPFLLWCNTTSFFVCSDKMTAIERTCFKGNVIQIIIGMEQQILSLVQTIICDIFFE